MDATAMTTPRPLTIRYSISFEGGEDKEFHLLLHPDTLELLGEPGSDLPTWTVLEFHRCRVCPLTRPAHTHCPVAARLVDVVEYFKDVASYRPAEVSVAVEERTYTTRCTAQTLLSSLIGVYMVTSGCPILDRLRPMVETHLPFASERDTVYRVVSMYLFAQYALKRHGRRPDWNLRRLVTFYEQVDCVNRDFCGRLFAVPHRGDADINAITKLNSLAWLTRITLREDRLTHWEDLFFRFWGEE